MMTVDEVINGFKLRNIEIDNIEYAQSIDTELCDYVRVKVPAQLEYQKALENQGFFRADRMLKASINIKKDVSYLDGKLRQSIIKSDEYLEDIYDLATKSFPVDRRFHVEKEYNNELANQIIRQRMEEISDYYVVLYKEKMIGFAGIAEIKPGIYEIKLAAVDEKYRMLGAALSLYGSLVKELHEKGGTKLIGWISSVNVAVMNLYSALQANFSDPSDIYIWSKK